MRSRGCGIVVAVTIAALAATGAVRYGSLVASGDPPARQLTAYGLAHRDVPAETATFAAGCFWKLEQAMRRVPGVISTTAGYCGGPETRSGASPTHASVAAGHTGHAEAVRVTYDPGAVSYEKLLDTFWSSHDPTRFAPDPAEAPASSPPGRSVVFYHSPAQRSSAEASKQRLQASGKYPHPIPTEILPATLFHPAEDEHQQFLDKHAAANTSCRLRR
jgi:methionine-S-sulfoxide reductase